MNYESVQVVRKNNMYKKFQSEGLLNIEVGLYLFQITKMTKQQFVNIFDRFEGSNVSEVETESKTYLHLQDYLDGRGAEYKIKINPKYIKNKSLKEKVFNIISYLLGKHIYLKQIRW